MEVFSLQELAEGWRLACQAYPTSDCQLDIPAEAMTTRQRIQLEGMDVTISPEPAVRPYELELNTPSLGKSQADADCLLVTLNRQYQLECHRIDVDVLHSLSTELRTWNWRCQATVRHDEVIAVAPRSSRQLGLAIDLGTTKIAGYLVNLADGHTLAAEGIMNPQISHGEDIITRIARTIESPDEGIRLRTVVVEAINELATNLCSKVGATTREIVETVVVGNTAMHHLFLGLPLEQLAVSPFVPAIARALDVKARDLGIHIASGAYVHLPPNIAGFVGSDHVSVLLATKSWQSEGLIMVVDIGTNTEISLVNDGKITTVSCASGPAFEGGHIKDGMRASSGAIERLRIEHDRLHYQTVNEAPPVGICGSGILSGVAQLYLHGIIDERGRMEGSHPRIRVHEGRREFVLVNEGERNGRPAIVITQHDVRELQKAKAAIRSGIQVLLEANGCSEKEIDKIVIAGVFGSYIDITSALVLGMFPPIPLDRFLQVGNAAGTGARLALISADQRAQAQAIASQVRYLELASWPNFADIFMAAHHLGQYQINHGLS